MGMNPKLTALAAKRGGVFSRQDALRCGYTPEQIRARLADGRWRRIRHGQYAEFEDLQLLSPWERELAQHSLAVHAAVNSLRAGSVVVSHQSALVMHRVPIWGIDLSEVHVTRTDRVTGRGAAGIRHHLGKLGQDDTTEVSGLPVTTVSRACVEMACTTSFEAAVVSADAVLRGGRMQPEAVDRLLEVTEFWPGSATARAVLAFADGRSESVGESRLRVLMDTHRLPVPVLQACIQDRSGDVFARVDFYFPEQRTVVEFDGLVKYGERADLIQEKRREDRLRDLGLQVVRVTWSELDKPGMVVARIRRAFARAAQADAKFVG